ncbi:MAG: UDP-N-acetylenolpyruvoylglucosamine reductase, partial [Haemophilus parainfluenzae]|nr:UDP-N-acetylenolpyruvoylglucosamine reductase [Haemophilus parainfluenzae]
HHIRQTVADKFGVYLQPEVRFMGEKGEVNSEQAIS